MEGFREEIIRAQFYALNPVFHLLQRRQHNDRDQFRAGALLEARQFYYPYWTARLSGETTSLTTSPSSPDGLLSFSVPPGNHDVELRLERSRAELAGQIISLASAAIALALALYLVYFGATVRQIEEAAAAS